MEAIIAYHITEIANLRNIAKMGLVPDIGKNTKYVYNHSHTFYTYFATLDKISYWMNLLKIDKDSVVLLKFESTNYHKGIIDNVEEYYTNEIITPDRINVIYDGEELPLIDFYHKYKKSIDMEADRSINRALTIVTNRLKQIEKLHIYPERKFEYHETEPNLVDIMDLLKKIRFSDNKSEFTRAVSVVKKMTLKKLIDNNLGITEKCALYKALDMLFDDALAKNPKLDNKVLNFVTPLLSINLYYRQYVRYIKTGKNYGYDNTIWELNKLSLEIMANRFGNNTYLLNLLEETINFNNYISYNYKKGK